MLNLNTIAKNELNQFLSVDTQQALERLLTENSTSSRAETACLIADAFGACGQFACLIADASSERDACEEKLLANFERNLQLLVQKTWVEKSDETVKEHVLYRLEPLCKALKMQKYIECFADVLAMLSDTVYLLFGPQTKKAEFLEYALRIDPEFGVFWWYISNVATLSSPLDDEQARILLLLGIYFLANY